MAEAVEITVDVRPLEAFANRLHNGPARFDAAIDAAMEAAMTRGERRAAVTLTAPGGYKTRTPGKLHVRSGQLRRLLAHKRSRSGGTRGGLAAEYTGGVGLYRAPGGVPPIYAFTHEFGLSRDIVPTGGRKLLTLPTDEALTPAGVERFTAREVIAGETQYEGGFWRTPEGGRHPILFGEEHGGDIVPLFVGLERIKKSAIPGVQYAGGAVREEAPILMREINGWFVDEFLNERGGA